MESTRKFVHPERIQGRAFGLGRHVQDLCVGSTGTTPCTRVQWETRGAAAACSEFLSAKAGCDEEGSVQYKVGGGEASLYFISPGRVGIPNDCDVKILDGGPGKLTGSCKASIGLATDMTYVLHSASK
jgi:hypothetical protein